MDDILNTPTEDFDDTEEEATTVLPLSELLTPSEYKLYEAFLTNLLYFPGKRFRQLLKAVAESAYNRAIEDKMAKMIDSRREEVGDVIPTDIPIERADKALIEAALEHAENMEDKND